MRETFDVGMNTAQRALQISCNVDSARDLTRETREGEGDRAKFHLMQFALLHTSATQQKRFAKNVQLFRTRSHTGSCWSSLLGAKQRVQHRAGSCPTHCASRLCVCRKHRTLLTVTNRDRPSEASCPSEPGQCNYIVRLP